MQVLNRANDQIILKEEKYFLGFGIGLIAMSVSGINMLIEFFFVDGASFSEDVIGVIFLSVWVLTVLLLSAYCFVEFSKKITINANGVYCKTWISKKALKWNEIEDWGISYYGRMKWGGNCYNLYFSENVNQIKNSCSKRLKGKMIKVLASEEDYYGAANDVISFCKELSHVEPFVGEDKFHFL